MKVFKFNDVLGINIKRLKYLSDFYDEISSKKKINVKAIITKLLQEAATKEEAAFLFFIFGRDYTENLRMQESKERLGKMLKLISKKF